MIKNKIPPGGYIMPTPVVLVGANVKGKPNFNAIGWAVGLEHRPPLVSISSNQIHHNNVGIRENQTFSINIPSEDMVEITDYCGIKSGRRNTIDKGSIFDVFYGELKTAPMIREAPINMECKVIHTVDTTKISSAPHGHDIFIGEVVQAYCEEKYFTDGAVDASKVRPMALASTGRNKLFYYSLGKQVGRAFKIGLDYKKK